MYVIGIELALGTRLGKGVEARERDWTGQADVNLTLI